MLSAATLTALWPGRCAHCGIRSGTPLCAACVALDLPQVPRCRLCAQALPTGARSDVCGACRLHPPRWAGAMVLGDYRPPNDRLILRLKFSAEPALGRWFGDLLAARWDAAGWPRPQQVLAVPLSRQRLLERGYNPAWEIARRIARHWSRPQRPQALQRLRQGPAQSSLSLTERRRNIRGAYACADRFDGQSLLLIDDVITSGATMDELTRLLLRQGAQSVWVAAALRTPPHDV